MPTLVTSNGACATSDADKADVIGRTFVKMIAAPRSPVNASSDDRKFWGKINEKYDHRLQPATQNGNLAAPPTPADRSR